MSTAAELSWGDEPVGKRGSHPTRGRTGPVGFDRRRIGDGAPGLLAIQGVGERPQRGGEFTDRAMQVEHDPTGRWRSGRGRSAIHAGSIHFQAPDLGTLARVAPS